MIETISLGTFHGVHEGPQKLLAKIADYVRRNRIGFHAEKHTTSDGCATVGRIISPTVMGSELRFAHGVEPRQELTLTTTAKDAADGRRARVSGLDVRGRQRPPRQRIAQPRRHLIRVSVPVPTIGPMTYTPATKTVSTVVSDWLAPLLKSRGYVRQGTTWRQDAPPLVRVFELQRHHRSTATEAEFYLNASVYATPLAEMLGAPALPSPDEPSCHLRMRPEDVQDTLPPCFRVRAGHVGEDAATLGPAVVEVATVMLDRLAEFTTVDDVVDVLSHHLLAAYEQVYGWYLHTGRPEAAKDFADGLHDQFGGQTRWRVFDERLRRVAERVGPAA